MLLLLSPAKNLDFSPPPLEVPRTAPRLGADIAALSKVTARLKKAEIARLMDLSDALADLNHQRFQALDPHNTGDGTLQAALAFNGDVYRGLSARDLGGEDLAWAQDNVRILSGLYGVLRPLDVIAPYRLEMGTRLKTRRGNSLYDFWGPRIAQLIKADLDGHACPVVINLASTEYFGAVDVKALKARVVTCAFHEVKDGQSRILSFYAKAARGLMARYAIDHRITDPEGLKAFDTAGYAFDPAASKADTWVFSRPQPDLKA
jgi:uncharacterized protein